MMILITSCKIESSYTKADWTLIFYLADDYSTLNLTNDILELTKNEVNTKNIRLVLLYDGPEPGDSKLEVLDSPFTMNSRVIPLSNTIIDTDENGDLDMADQKTLESYLTYIKDKLPANRYALYFGSHGTGFSYDSNDRTDSYNYLSGLAVENDGNTWDSKMLTITEIANATLNTGGIDLVTFDACNIGNIETIYEFNGAADYVIASPELIPGPGNDYIGFVQAAYNATDLSTLSLGKATLEVYYNYYNLPDNERNMGKPYYHEAKSVQQLYNVDKIVEIVGTQTFKSELLNFVDNKTSKITKFNIYNTYSNIYDLIADTSDFDDAIIIPKAGIYTWISIYIPYSTYYNSNYEETKFAKSNPDWIKDLTSQ